MKKEEFIKLGVDEETAVKCETATELELKKPMGEVETLKGEIATLEADIKRKDETHAGEINTIKINMAVDKAISSAKGKNATAIKALLNLTETELLEDGTVKGLSEQLEKLTKAPDSMFMFDANETPKADVKGATPAEGEKGAVDKSKMTYSEIANYLAENPGATLQ